MADLKNSKFFYPILIFLIWLFMYIICNSLWEHQIWWDETSYLSTARGIVRDFDFSSRTTTVQGTLKYNFPQHTHHYPLHSVYMAIFLKLFGDNLNSGYLSVWISGLITVLFIYLTCNLFFPEKKFLSFIVGISFMFFPRILHYFDSGMMEIPCCALLSMTSCFVFKNLKLGKINPFLIALFSIWLYCYKSLFVGTVFGFLVLIILSSAFKDLNIKSKFNGFQNVCVYLGLFVFLYIVLSKFIFLSLAPMMNFLSRLETPEGAYADFAGGFLSDPFGYIKISLAILYQNFIVNYSIYNVVRENGLDAFYVSIPNVYEYNIYLITIFFISVFLITLWKRINSLGRLYILFTISSIFFMNFFFALIAGGSPGILCRYNIHFVPNLLISFVIILNELKNDFMKFYLPNKVAINIISCTLFLIVYIPYYRSANAVMDWEKKTYSGIANGNSKLIEKFTGNTNLRFIYFTVGNHSTWNNYPLRVIAMEATGEQIKKLNYKLGVPIEYLFIFPHNYLFKENQDKILKALPIIDNWYTFYGFDKDSKVFVYRFNPVNK